jgi:mono/diheme cytochrome c family protein
VPLSARARARRAPTRTLLVVVAVLGATASLGCKKPEDPIVGRELFTTACSRCHGPEARGGLPISDGGPSPRNFHDHAFQTTRTDDQIKHTIVNGKPPGMPPFGAMFTEAQLTSLVAFVRTCDPGEK